MANDLSKIVELPLHNQKLAGFGARKPYIGCVVNDMKEPVKPLNPGIEIEQSKSW